MSQPRPTDPIGSIGWTERTGGVLTARECLTLARPLLRGELGRAQAGHRLGAVAVPREGTGARHTPSGRLGGDSLWPKGVPSPATPTVPR